MAFEKIRNKPLINRVIIFIVLLVIWFFIAYMTNSTIADAVKRASNLTTLWIISGFIIAILWSIFFPGKKDNIKK